jgi:hypothetical protein
MKKNILGILFTTFLLAGCSSYDDLSKLNAPGYSGEFAIPLVNTKTNLKEIFDGFDQSATLEIDGNGGMVLRYKGNIISKTSQEIFDLASNAFFPILDTSFSIPLKRPNGVFLDSINVKSGSINMGLYNDQTFPVTMTVKLPEFKKNGISISKTYSLAPKQGLPTSIDIAGYDLVPVNDSIKVIYDARDKSNNNRIKLSGFLFAFSDAKFSFARGYIGRDTFDNKADSINIDFFKNWKRGKVTFSDPKIRISLDNSFGLPVKSIVKRMDIEGLDGTVNSLQSIFITDGVNVAYPSLNEIGQLKNTTFFLDKTNSNIDKIINSNPVKVVYEIDGLINPDLGTKPIGFMTDSSYFKLEVETILPLEGTANGFESIDTFDMNWGDVTTVIDSAEFKIIADNEMPIDHQVQVYFAETDGKIVDSLFKSNTFILKSAPVGTNGIANGITTNTTFAKFSGPVLNKLRALARKIIVKSIFSTTDNGSRNVKVLANQNVNIRIGLRFATKL